jgi:3-oxosteroid 1-dehydrogenase
MAASWDESVDVVVVGSGAAGLVASIVVADLGLKPLIIEKSNRWGGTSAISGGGLWVPANPLMLADGASDTLEEAMMYLNSVIGEVGPASSPERRAAFLTNAPRLVSFLADEGFQWTRDRTFPDYFPTRQGAKVGRQLEGRLVDGKKLGKWLETLRTRDNLPPMAFKTEDAPFIPLMKRTLRGFARVVKVVLKTAAWNISGRRPLAAGNSLVGQLMLIALKHNVPLRMEVALQDLVIEDGKVTGVIVNERGQQRRIQACRCVMLTAGGFARNSDFRRKYQTVGEEFSSAVESDTGDAIQIAMNAGLATALMEESWWCPATVTPDNMRIPVVWERHLPHSILVDSTGARFMSEALPYLDAARAQIERNKIVPAIPAWLIMDARHRQRYPYGPVLGGTTPKDWMDKGTFICADSLEELAAKIQVNLTGLKRTVERFNSFADSGVDTDFQRGSDAFQAYYSDPKTFPNPNLGRIERAPFWAAPVVPGDLGTKGGLLTDESARVIRRDGGVMPGLYAAGNTTASVMGRTYPGPGVTLGSACTFAFIGMRHAVGTNEP